MNSPTSDDILELLVLAREPNAPEEVTRRLNERLRNDALAREVVARHLADEASLEMHLGSERVADLIETESSDIADTFLSTRRSLPAPVGRYRWVAALAAILAMVAILSWSQQDPEEEIVQVTGLSGSVQWTGEGGSLVTTLQTGDWLQAGMLESLAADSWAELRFRDGSVVTFFGEATVTISELDQKRLGLRKGGMSASVAPQQNGRPLLVDTPAARLEVLGTQLNVFAKPATTKLAVNEGRVRVIRLADGSHREVTADHQVLASLDVSEPLFVVRRPAFESTWQSSIPEQINYGTYLASDGVQAAPLLWTCEVKEPLMLRVCGLSVSSGDLPPVRLNQDGVIRVKGSLKVAADVYFGLTMHYPDGGFAGKYVAHRKFFSPAGTPPLIDVAIPVNEFTRDKPRFPESPIGLEVVDWWALTINHDAGLVIGDVALTNKEPNQR